MRALLEEGHRNEVEILTSVLSITEVAFGAHERDTGLSSVGEEQIDKLWEPASPINLVDISQRVTVDARSILRDATAKSIGGMRAADALHLATAKLLAVDVVYTYEKQSTRAKWLQLIGIDIEEPVTAAPQLDV